MRDDSQKKPNFDNRDALCKEIFKTSALFTTMGLVLILVPVIGIALFGIGATLMCGSGVAWAANRVQGKIAGHTFDKHSPDFNPNERLPVRSPFPPGKRQEINEEMEKFKKERPSWWAKEEEKNGKGSDPNGQHNRDDENMKKAREEAKKENPSFLGRLKSNLRRFPGGNNKDGGLGIG